jgi:serine/threonine protein kinase
MIEKILGQRYKLTERIHVSDVAESYHALDTALPRMVTVKIYKLKDIGNSIESWKKAAQITASLSHPNVVSLFDMGFDGDHCYLVMEHLEGRTLQQIIRERRRFTLEEVISYCHSLADALVYAHKMGVLHGSLSTANVWWNGATVKIADFCVDGIIKNDVNQTRESDLVQLGKLIDEWLVGTVPLTNEPLRQMFERIIDRAIGRKPPVYQDVQQMANDLLTLKQSFTQVSSAKDTREDKNVYVKESSHTSHDKKSLASQVNVFTRAGRSEKKAYSPAEPKKRIHLLNGLHLFKRNTKRKRTFQAPTTVTDKAKSVIVSLLGAGAGVAAVVVVTLVALSYGFFSGHTTKTTAGKNDQQQPATQVQAAGNTKNGDTTNQKNEQQDNTENNTPDGTAPNVVGLTQQEAQNRLIAAGYRYYYEIQPSNQPSGTVFKQEPAAGTTLPKGSRVQFWVSQ